MTVLYPFWAKYGSFRCFRRKERNELLFDQKEYNAVTWQQKQFFENFSIGLKIISREFISSYGASVFELLRKIVYQYNFEDFDDIIDSFMTKNAKNIERRSLRRHSFNRRSCKTAFCKNLNRGNLERYLAFISQSGTAFTWKSFIYYLIEALTIVKEIGWSFEKWISVLKWFDFEGLSTNSSYSDSYWIWSEAESKLLVIKIIIKYLEPSRKQSTELFEIIGVEKCKFTEAEIENSTSRFRL